MQRFCRRRASPTAAPARRINPLAQTTTIVTGLDDSAPGQVYFEAQLETASTRAVTRMQRPEDGGGLLQLAAAKIR